jgi:hypothetical protein
LDWLDGVGANDAGFLWTHIADVVIYRYFLQRQGQIRDLVQSKIVTEVESGLAADSSAEFSLMAHSLGTAVAHDSLARLGSSENLGGHVNVLSARNFHFASIHMLANVSRLLQTDFKTYESVVRPGERDGATSYCLRMFCHRHELDPFVKPKPFEPAGWGGRFLLENLDHYRGWNVHGWLHYLDNPLVHIPILNSITRSTAIGRRTQGKAVDAYAQFGESLENVAAAKVQLRELRILAGDISKEQGLEQNFDVLRDMWRVIGKLKDLAGDTWNAIEGSAL